MKKIPGPSRSRVSIRARSVRALVERRRSQVAQEHLRARFSSAQNGTEPVAGG